MTLLRAERRPARATPLRRVRTRWARRLLTAEAKIAYLLGVVAVLVVVAVSLWPDRVPFTSLIVPLVLASILLGPRTLPWFVLGMVALLGLSLSQQQEVTSKVVGAAVVQLVVAMIVLVTSLRRTRLGVAGLRGESMFVDLRDRILHQGVGFTDLPAPWTVESALHSAGGTAFAGDFIVSSRSPCGRVLEVVVVDVSGKGEAAGTRALLLSGAFGGLLGALPSQGFLPAANDYLLRQRWEEGFATAVHLSLDVESGAFEVRTAGHPPAAHRTVPTNGPALGPVGPTGSGAAVGRWTLLASEGPILGLVDDAEFTCARGVLGPGEALLLYTDGMVEEPRRDIELGIDEMLGEADSLLGAGSPAPAVRGLVERLALSVGSPDDDRAVLLVHRG